MEKSGLLNKGLFSWIRKDQHIATSWFSLCDDLDKLSHTVIFGLKINGNNSQQVLVALLYIKILSTFQAIVTLAEREMLNESKILLRSLLESVFALVAISKDAKVADRFIEDDHIQRLRLLNTCRDLSPKFQKLLKPRVDKLLKSRLNNVAKSQTKTQDITPLTVEYLAAKAELEELYYSVFVLLPGSSYLRVYELEQYWEGHTSGKSVRRLANPILNRTDAVLFTAIKSILLSLNSVINTFNVKIPKGYIQLIGQFRSLAKTQGKSKSKHRASAEEGLRKPKYS